MKTITLTRPDDWHLHLRDGDALKAVVGHTAAQFGRAIVMPNLLPPVTTVAQAIEYPQRILTALPAGSHFNPLMTLCWRHNPRSIAVEPAGRFAYVANANAGNVSVYTINATTGALTGAGTVAAGISPWSIAVDTSGKFAYVANQGGDNVSVFSIDATTGALTSVGVPVAAGSVPVPITTITTTGTIQ